MWKAVLFYEKLSTNVSESDKYGWYFIKTGNLLMIDLQLTTGISEIQAMESLFKVYFW